MSLTWLLLHRSFDVITAGLRLASSQGKRILTLLPSPSLSPLHFRVGRRGVRFFATQMYHHYTLLDAQIDPVSSYSWRTVRGIYRFVCRSSKVKASRGPWLPIPSKNFVGRLTSFLIRVILLLHVLGSSFCIVALAHLLRAYLTMIAPAKGSRDQER